MSCCRLTYHFVAISLRLERSGVLDQQEFAACYADLVGVDPSEAQISNAIGSFFVSLRLCLKPIHQVKDLMELVHFVNLI